MEFPKQIEAVSLSRAANAAHYEFMAQVQRRIEAHQAGPSRWGEAAGEFTAAFEAEDTAFKAYQASLRTPPLAEADARRDAAYTSLYAAVRTFAGFPIEETAELGRMLLRVFQNYKVDTSASYQKESGTVANLLQDLDGNDEAGALDSLGLRDLTERLRAANEEVRRLIDERSEDRGTQAAMRMKEVRAETDRAFALLVLMTNAALSLDPADSEAQWLVDVLQADLDYFRRYNMAPHSSAQGGGTQGGGDQPDPPANDDPVSSGDGQGTEPIEGDPGLLP